MVKNAVIIGLNSCKNRCLFCNPKGWLTMIDDVKFKEIEEDLNNQVKELQCAGIRELEISGADPLEYKNIAKFIKHIKEDFGIRYVQISTHGRDLSNKELVKDLRDAGLDEIRIPIYGSIDGIHDSITQEKGSFKESVTGIKNVIKYAPKIKVYITSLIMKQNYKDVLNIFKLASKFSKKISFGIPCITHLVDASDFVVSFDKIRPYLLGLLLLSDKKECSLMILDIPYCIFGFYRKEIMISSPPLTAGSYSVPEIFRSGLKYFPSYRIKSKIGICQECKLNNICDGFYDKYIELFDLSYLKPL